MRREESSFSLSYVALCCVVCLLLGVTFSLYLKSGAEVDSSAFSYYYQDLNSVEVKIGSYPIDPEIIKAIHHFQEAPFGVSLSQSDDSDVDDVPDVAELALQIDRLTLSCVVFEFIEKLCYRFFCVCLVVFCFYCYFHFC